MQRYEFINQSSQAHPVYRFSYQTKKTQLSQPSAIDNGTVNFQTLFDTFAIVEIPLEHYLKLWRSNQVSMYNDADAVAVLRGVHICNSVGNS